jgi:hypothetical protein
MADQNTWKNESERNEGQTCADHSEGGRFEIHVQGQLDSRWSEWLEGLEVKLLENGEMILSGSIVDQASLIGVLNKLGSLNLKLLSVNEVKKTSKKEICND